MNILLFVTALIMVLSMLTYAKLQTYQNFRVLESQFTRFMEESERSYINKTAVWWYENSVATKKGKNPPASGKNPGRSRLSFVMFIDRKKQAQYASTYPKMIHITKKLIDYLYRNQPFFQQFIQRRPDIVDELLASLIIADDLPKEEKIKKPADLANLNLGDPLLNSFFYYILKGSPLTEKEEEKEIQESQKGFILKESAGEAEDEGGDPNKKQYYISPKGYHSLLDYIHVDDAIKIRVYLASEPLLMAIFDHPSTVNAIITMRNELYKKVIHDSLNPQEATAQFKAAFSSLGDPSFNETLLDYTVTKTNPKNYSSSR